MSNQTSMSDPNEFDIIPVPADTDPADQHASPDADDSTRGAARAEGDRLKRRAEDEGHQLADSGRQEAGQVAADAQQEAKSLVADGKAEAGRRINEGQQQLASWVRSLSDEAHSMVTESSAAGPLNGWMDDLSGRGDQLAGWLENHQPSEALDEVQRFAARSPWAFLGISAAAGLVAGRLLTNAREASQERDW